MKKVLIFFSALFLIFFNSIAQNRFKNPDKNIELLEFRSDGMFLRLTIDGIKYAKKAVGRRSIASKVLALHNKMTNNTSEFQVSCIMARIYYHAKGYSIKNPNWFLNKNAREISAKYYELIWREGCKAPLDIID